MAQVDDGCLGQDTLTPCPDCPSDDSELSMGAETFARGCDCVSISSFPGERQVQEDTASLVSTATLVPECIYIPPSGFQLLSDQELAQHKVALQSTSERLDKVTREREALQEALRCSTEDCANQVNVLLDQIKSSEKLLDGLQSNMSDTQQKTARQMAALTASFNRLCQEVNILSDENEKLRAIGGATSPEEQTPAVQTSSVQRAAQYRQERLCIEIVSLQEELKSEQAAKQGLEEQLQREKETHTEEREILEATLSSLRTEMDRIQQERKQTDLQLQESESQVQKLWDSLGEQEKILQEEREEKASLHETLLHERNKIFRLQTDLATSEEVQRDFVRLSQSLQVSLEKIRQAKSLKEVQDILEGTRLTDVNQLQSVRAIESSEEHCIEMEELNLIHYSQLTQRHQLDASTKMAAKTKFLTESATSKMTTSDQSDIATTKMAAVTTKMATATSKMATTGYKTMTYNPNMPLEMADDLPPSAGMIIHLIQNLRLDLKNDFKKDFDTIYGVIQGIGQRIDDIEYRLQAQEQSHQDLVDTVKDLQKSTLLLTKLHCFSMSFYRYNFNFPHLRCHGDVEWENGLENTFETLRNRIDRRHTEIIVPVFVYSAKYDFTKRRPDEISPFIREACRITGIFPLIVLTQCKNINTDMVCEQFRELGASYIMSIENYTAKNPRRNAETDTKILDFLDVCMKKADQAIDMKQHENNNIEFFNEAMRQVKELVKDKLKEKEAKIQELQKQIKINEGVNLLIQSERAKLKEEINSLKNLKNHKRK
ncbi:Hypothetical predicted protein [Pelobates cultripes]|uniref:Rab GTPase-binding effector protein 2 n=1 Tax=Pelobates cultripes TaxID=61616 RepID=A0AAD1WJ31_PELCU|nr:Hypothetical predicted protein [Pelobates cultripes]